MLPLLNGVLFVFLKAEALIFSLSLILPFLPSRLPSQTNCPLFATRSVVKVLIARLKLQYNFTKMEVQLYLYDLSRGLARTVSATFLGAQLDAVYHTSIVLQGVEYVRAVHS